VEPWDFIFIGFSETTMTRANGIVTAVGVLAVALLAGSAYAEADEDTASSTWRSRKFSMKLY
jgi:hypothetical protein